MTVRELIRRFRAAGIPEAEYEARRLFAAYSDAPESERFLGTAQTDSPALTAAAERRLSGEPLAYILGNWDFYRENYLVSPACLIPRQDTEILVDYAVGHLPPGAEFLDLCTGSGCIALSVLAHTENTRACAVDLSEEALALAGKNARRLGLSERVRFLRSDVLRDTVPGAYDAILSNPPYVDDAVYPTLQKEISFEPAMAFLGGADGMDFYRAILRHYKNSLRPGGFFAFEIGYDQGERMRALARAAGFAAQILPDLGGNDRVAVLTPM